MTAGLWLYKEPGWECVTPGEIRYSIRSAVKHLAVDEVWLVGDRPDWATNVGHIPGVADRGQKFDNLMHDLLAALQSPDVPDRFLLMNDDFHILRSYPLGVENIGTLSGRVESNRAEGVTGSFHETFENTLAWLRDRGIADPLCFELHRPMPIVKADALDALEAILPHDPPLHARTVYGALCGLRGRCIRDLKLTGYTKNDEWRGMDIVSTDEAGWQGKPGNWLRAQSPEPSPFER